MKNYILPVFIGFVLLLASCKKKDVFVFDDGNELFFEKFYEDEIFPGTGSADSTLSSFFFYPDGTQDIEVPLVLNLSGKLLTSSGLKFGLKVVADKTTANANEYTIDPSYTFSPKMAPNAKEIKDTIMVKMHRSARLDQLPQGVRLVVELVPNSEVGLGQTERIKAKIILTTIASKPEWWNDEVTTSLLGQYTQKKFKVFLNEIDKDAEMNGKFIENRPDQAKKMVLEFKAWLNAQNPKILEEDGSLMEVAI
jgi:hypothetical protein